MIPGPTGTIRAMGGRGDQGVDERLAAFYRGRRVAVAGGASFIGSHLTERLVDAGAVVRVGDDLSSGRLDHLVAVRSDVEVVVGDLRDRNVAERTLAGADVVFHLAARHGGREYIDAHPVDCVGNAALDFAVFSAAADAGAERIVFASSACVYPVDPRPGADGGSTPLVETDADFEVPGHAFADGEYGWAKLYGELQLGAFARERQLHGVVCRLFNAYGPRESDTHAIVALAVRALNKCDPYDVWGDGSQRRSFTHVDDVTAGLALAGTHAASDVFNIGNPSELTIDELCERIFDTVGWRPSTVRHLLDRPVGSHARRPDVTKAATELGWRAFITLEAGLPGLLDDCRRRSSIGELTASAG